MPIPQSATADQVNAVLLLYEVNTTHAPLDSEDKTPRPSALLHEAANK